MPSVPTIDLNNGVQIPQLGFGVFQIAPDKTVEAVLAALDVGYRHIDTAQMYGNEEEVGDAIARSDVDPGEVFVTSKLNNNRHGFGETLRAFDETVAVLGVDRVDLFLIHWPLPTVGDFVETWRAMERIYAEGRARSIGVSNFQEAHLRRLLDETDVVPAVNQIELHPFLTQRPLHDFGSRHGIATEAWSPIAQGRVLEDATINALAETHGRSPAQVVLRWHIQLGHIVFPKSVRPARMQQNFDIFGFELTGDDLAAISACNRDERTGPDPDTFDFVPG